METAKILVFDGSFNGFLTTVYTAFENRWQVAGIRKRKDTQEVLFAETREIRTDLEKARRVWQGVEQKNYQVIKNIYFAFLSERNGIEQQLYRYIRGLFARPDLRDEESFIQLRDVIDQQAQLVAQEKKQVEASIRFQKTTGSIHMAMISPRANIVPLIAKFLRLRNPNGSWMVYDKKRKFALYCHQQQMEWLRLSNTEATLLLNGPVTIAENVVAAKRGSRLEQACGRDKKYSKQAGPGSNNYKWRENSAA